MIDQPTAEQALKELEATGSKGARKPRRTAATGRPTSTSSTPGSA